MASWTPTPALIALETSKDGQIWVNSRVAAVAVKLEKLFYALVPATMAPRINGVSNEEQLLKQL